MYRRLGNLSTDIARFGINRESTLTRNAPFFLAECRRRTFAAAFQIDKFIATLLDRPPRILRRYSDCSLPLDLTDEDLLAGPDHLSDVCSALTEDGWSPRTQYTSATWQRLRFAAAAFRERILEFSKFKSKKQMLGTLLPSKASSLEKGSILLIEDAMIFFETVRLDVARLGHGSNSLVLQY